MERAACRRKGLRGSGVGGKAGSERAGGRRFESMGRREGLESIGGLEVLAGFEPEGEGQGLEAGCGEAQGEGAGRKEPAGRSLALVGLPLGVGDRGRCRGLCEEGQGGADFVGDGCESALKEGLGLGFGLEGKASVVGLVGLCPLLVVLVGAADHEEKAQAFLVPRGLALGRGGGFGGFEETQDPVKALKGGLVLGFNDHRSGFFVEGIGLFSVFWRFFGLGQGPRERQAGPEEEAEGPARKEVGRAGKADAGRWNHSCSFEDHSSSGSSSKGERDRGAMGLERRGFLVCALEGRRGGGRRPGGEERGARVRGSLVRGGGARRGGASEGEGSPWDLGEVFEEGASSPEAISEGAAWSGERGCDGESGGKEVEGGSERREGVWVFGGPKKAQKRPPRRSKTRPKAKKRLRVERRSRGRGERVVGA